MNEMNLDEYHAWLATQKQPKPTRDDREHQEQAALFQWAALMEPRIPALRLLFAIPNGGDRHPAVAAKLKAEGVKAGVWDIFLPVAKRGYIGLWLEMKVNGNTLMPAQADWGMAMLDQNYTCKICHDWTTAARHIVIYLGYAPEDYDL